MYKEFLINSFENLSNCFLQLKKCAPEIEQVAKECIFAIKNGNKIMFCGNGGSAADAQHLCAELVGRYKLNRRAYQAISLNSDTSVLTAIANDFGYAAVFERQIEGIGVAGDVLVVISTSGESENLLMAVNKAKKMGIKTVAMLGAKKCVLTDLVDYVIAVPSVVTNNIQEMQIAVGHLICEIIEKELNNSF